ncbi:MAG: polysaccharide biosynthesis/export protein [Fimbriimonadaceae bacterium]|nr:polysaccharide biosynthesis/export protein [Fimbriimonadaceae bacterium]
MKRFNPIRMFIAAALALSVVSVPVAAMAQGKTDDKPKSLAPTDYKIGPEDILTIITRDMPEASGDIMVRPDGTISFPIVGVLKAAGLTPDELQEKLREALKKELRDPVVTVNVKQMRINRIYILGIVSHPGLYDFKPGWRLTELIASAGGLALMPERLSAVIFRASQPNKTISMKELFIDGKDDMNTLLQPGDVINIRSDAMIRINVVGSVQRPGQLDIQDGQGAVEALSAAGGSIPDSALSKAVIRRGTDNIKVNLYNAVVKGDPSLNVALKAGDTLYVPQLYERVSVVGTVNRPGTHTIPDGREYTISDAIADAGGPAQRAELKGVVLARQDEDGKVQQIPINYKELGKKQANLALKDRDVLYVPESGKASTSQIASGMNLWFLVKNLIGIR